MTKTDSTNPTRSSPMTTTTSKTKKKTTTTSRRRRKSHCCEDYLIEAELERVKEAKTMHEGVLKAINVSKMTASGCRVKIWIADWFAQLNNKMGGDLKKIETVGKCSQIMGRTDQDELTTAQILYPCMQCADIFFLQVEGPRSPEEMLSALSRVVEESASVLVAERTQAEERRNNFRFCWRLSLGLASFPAGLLTLGALLVVETPNSLVERGLLE